MDSDGQQLVHLDDVGTSEGKNRQTVNSSADTCVDPLVLEIHGARVPGVP